LQNVLQNPAVEKLITSRDRKLLWHILDADETDKVGDRDYGAKRQLFRSRHLHAVSAEEPVTARILRKADEPTTMVTGAVVEQV
jgi:hypothetical protein